MPSPTAVALTGFIAWTLFFLVLMEGIRAKLVLTKRLPANGFTPDNANLSAFTQRLTRAHANCLEGLPIIGGLMLVGWPPAGPRSPTRSPSCYSVHELFSPASV